MKWVDTVLEMDTATSIFGQRDLSLIILRTTVKRQCQVSAYDLLMIDKSSCFNGTNDNFFDASRFKSPSYI